ncbi:MAG: DUF4062 domain-containing protein [Pseudomonadota bacterium]
MTTQQHYPAIMLSSTFLDLEEHRAKALEAIRKAKCKSNDMESSIAEADRDVIDASLAMVQSAGAYVCIIGARYGQTPVEPDRNPGGLSLTELEFDEALHLELPILLFLMSEKHPVLQGDVEIEPDKRAKLAAFTAKAKLKVPGGTVSRIYDAFDSVGDFAEKAGLAIMNLAHELRQGPSPTAKAPATKAPWPQVEPPGIAPVRTVQGRDADVARLHETLSTHGAAAILPSNHKDAVLGGTVLKGAGGIGKTTLARHYVATYRTAYRGIWWLRTETEETLIEDLCALAGHLGIRTDDHATPKAAAQATIMAVAQTPGPWLLVFDNAEAAADLTRWRPTGGAVRVIATSRGGRWDGYAEHATERLTPEAATDLLLQEAERSEDRDGAKALAERLDCLPLALVLAGAWLRDAPACSFAQYAERIDQLLALEPETVELGDYPQSIEASVRLSLDALAAKAPDAACLMRVLAHLAPDDLWPGLITPLAEKHPEHEFYAAVPEALWSLARDGHAVDRAFSALVRASLLELTALEDGTETRRMHRLTAAVQRAVAAEGEGVPDWRAFAAATLAAGYPGGDAPQFIDSWPTCARLGPHVAALAQDPPEIAAMDYLLNQTSIYLSEQRQDETALAYAEASLTLKEARLGPDHEEVGTACNNLAVRNWRQGRLEEAEQLAARAVAIAEAGGTSDEHRAIGYGVHGLILHGLAHKLSGSEQAEKLTLANKRNQMALALNLRATGRINRDFAVRLNNLAELRVFHGRWGAALRLHGRALAIRRTILAAEDPALGASLINLATTLIEAGRAREGYRGASVLAMLTEALAIFEGAFPDNPTHPNRVTAARWLAIAHRTLLLLGQPFPYGPVPDAAEVERLCTAYAIDPSTIEAKAQTCAARARAWEADGTDPPGEADQTR